MKNLKIENEWRIIISFILGIIAACGMILFNRTEVVREPEPIKANIFYFDSGVEILNFDNSTLLPPLKDAPGIHFTCMDSEFILTGKVQVEVLK